MEEPEECKTCKLKPGDSISCTDCGVYPRRMAWWYEQYPEDTKEN